MPNGRPPCILVVNKGRALERKLIPVAAGIQHQATAGLADDDVATFMRVLAVIRDNLQAAPDAQDGRAARRGQPALRQV